MKEFIAYLIKNLVDDPNVVDISVHDEPEHTLIKIRVDLADVSKVVGRKGKTIQALRTIATNIGSRFGRRIKLEVIQP